MFGGSLYTRLPKEDVMEFLDIPPTARAIRADIYESMQGWKTNVTYQLVNGSEHYVSWPLRVRKELAVEDAERCIGPVEGAAVHVFHELSQLRAAE